MGWGEMAAVVGAAILTWNKLVVPFARWAWLRLLAATGVDELQDVDDAHEDRLGKLERDVGYVVDAVRPRNGDQRTIADKLDHTLHTIDAHLAQDRANFAALGDWAERTTGDRPTLIGVDE